MKISIESLALRPADTAVLQFDRPVSKAVADRLAKTWDEAMRDPRRTCVLEAGLSLAIIRREPETSMSILAGLTS